MGNPRFPIEVCVGPADCRSAVSSDRRVPNACGACDDLRVREEASRRKFRTEFTLCLTVVGTGLLRASDLKKTDPPEEKSHLYVISSTPVVTVDPANVVVGQGALVGKVTINNAGDLTQHDFALRYNGAVAEWRSEWPHTDFTLHDKDGGLLKGGPVGLLGHLGAIGWPTEASTHEVLYIGRSYGESGSSTAWDRLQKHEKLQQILAERRPDREIWLTLATIIDTKIISETAPGGGMGTTDEADTDHYAEVFTFVRSEGFKDGDGVSIAEAGLIRAFQPRYNIQLKESFPSPTQKSLTTVRELDFHSLVVEWQATNLVVEKAMAVDRYMSDSVPSCALGFFTYTIHTDSARAATLHFAIDKPIITLPLADAVSLPK
jgi:hypothetical protein